MCVVRLLVCCGCDDDDNKTHFASASEPKKFTHIVFKAKVILNESRDGRTTQPLPTRAKPIEADDFLTAVQLTT
jgi:hypothetical protein